MAIEDLFKIVKERFVADQPAAPANSGGDVEIPQDLLFKCPRCGEEYSPSYRRCPFCEEGDHPRKIKYNSSKQSGGRRVSDKKQTQSCITVYSQLR